ncbi:EscU/YscU/HrcU family type III secretion system export apparatus switch protein [Metabacillus idriensis]|uniref:EscU/YscU/HrcU family type III secretion system export apparatus switch protein n=1 Tax=Metabacillus idriensis TaxID=324768 RepID=UPI00281486A8|nr:EscU/YscU/HrcU family type III secretion system export apparatus switch protein [Metabacillus idriensis]MDR0137350.1 EscU/YscU/HrcU family type III secretion system export apparatus switch protein [Metabacillus idriensis]
MKNENKQKKAAALQYQDKKDAAPRVTAKGKGHVADTIIEAAKLNDVPVQEDPSLIEVLHKMEVNEQIPEELYQAVAEIFSFLYQVDKEAETKQTNDKGRD